MTMVGWVGLCEGIIVSGSFPGFHTCGEGVTGSAFDGFSLRSMVRSFSLSVSSEIDLKSSSREDWPVSGKRGSPDVSGVDSSGG